MSLSILQTIFLVSAVAFVGLISTFLELHYTLIDIIKDIIYFLRPITILSASYFVVKNIKSNSFVFNVVVTMALIFASIHLLIIIANIGNIDSYVYIRSLGGKQNHIEIVALVFLFFTPYTTVFKKQRKLITLIITLSVILYFSRTMFVILFLYFLGYKGYLFLNKRIIKGTIFFILTAIVLGVMISKVETNRDSTGIRKFIYKTQNSFAELFESVDVDSIKRDRRILWEHWRAYEAQKAIDQVKKNGIKAWLIGLGYGSQIDLETRVYLDGKFFTEVPSIHNGFIFVLFKTGLTGLFFYLGIIIFMFFKFQRFRTINSDSVLNGLIISTSLYVFFNSFVIAGFYRPGEFSLFIFAILLASQEKIQTIMKGS
tara:strand:+ start:2279 stop:3394 length:1116 start_codon:yes stop_codon:yes gene_type:complete